MGKMIEGDASVKEAEPKKGLAKFAHDFFAADAKSIRDYILSVLDQNVRKILSEAGNGVINMLLYGKEKAAEQSRVKKVNYSGRFDEEDVPVKEFGKRPTFTSIQMQSRSDCEAILKQAMTYLKRYPVIRVSDIFEWADIHTDNYMANDYGWNSVDKFEIVPIKNGWELRMPRPIPLDRDYN